MPEQSDHQLMIDVRDGNPAQLTELFERHHLKLFNFLLKLCGNRQWSEDMVQDTYIRVLKYSGSYRDDGNFIPWIFNIARNVAAQYLGQENLKSSSLLDADPNDAEAPHANPEYLQEMNERQQKLQEALLRLPAEKRELILLSKINSLSMADLAGLFDCSLNTIKVRLHRAIELLRDYYETE